MMIMQHKSPSIKRPLLSYELEKSVSSSIQEPTTLLQTSFKHVVSPGDQRFVRRNMIRLIECKIEQGISQDKVVVPKTNLAQALEQHLFKTAPSFREYADTKTLDSRIRLVMVALLRRRLNKSQKVSREDVLKQELGHDAYEKARSLVQKVKLLKLERLARDCPKCKDGACGIQGRPTTPFQPQEALPMPVRALFFNTSLVQAFESAPAERIPHLNWATILEEAHRNIEQYKKWDRASVERLSDDNESVSFSGENDLDIEMDAAAPY